MAEQLEQAESVQRLFMLYEDCYIPWPIIQRCPIRERPVQRSACSYRCLRFFNCVYQLYCSFHWCGIKDNTVTYWRLCTIWDCLRFWYWNAFS